MNGASTVSNPTETLTLTDFLLARLEEDRVRATLREWHDLDCETIPNDAGYSYPCECGVPERMAREAAAKRRLVEQGWDEVGPTTADEWLFALLALPYSDHPDYREEWRP